MHDHYKSRKMALWLNLIPDLLTALKSSKRNTIRKSLTSLIPFDILNYKLYRYDKPRTMY